MTPPESNGVLRLVMNGTEWIADSASATRVLIDGRWTLTIAGRRTGTHGAESITLAIESAPGPDTYSIGSLGVGNDNINSLHVRLADNDYHTPLGIPPPKSGEVVIERLDTDVVAGSFGVCVVKRHADPNSDDSLEITGGRFDIRIAR